MFSDMGYDPDTELTLFLAVVAMAVLVCAAVYLVVWMVRGSLDEARYKARRNREREERTILAMEADCELQNDLLDLGFTRHDLREHRTVHEDYDGVEQADYELPPDQFAEQVKRAAQVHSRVVEAFGSRRTPCNHREPGRAALPTGRRNSGAGSRSPGERGQDRTAGTSKEDAEVLRSSTAKLLLFTRPDSPDG
ncbi:MAG: hypothetical protein JST91_03015 [Actinobacteria bacterium]|nr:hypothetical protein [Actinomycetota bacterium]